MAGSPDASPSNLPYSCGDFLDPENLPPYWCEFEWSEQSDSWTLVDESLPENYHCKPPTVPGSLRQLVYLFPCPNTPPNPSPGPEPFPDQAAAKLSWPSKTFKMPGLSERPESPPDSSTSTG